MARRIVNRKEKRAEFEAYERTNKEDEEREDEEEEEVDEDAEEEAAEGGDEAGDEEEADEDDEEAPKKKKKEPKAKAKPKARTRTAKVVRMKVVWAVYNNSNQQVKTFDYPDRKAADEYAAKMMTDKKSTFFVQPFKKPFEEKKDD